MGFAQSENEKKQKSPIVEKGGALTRTQADVESMRNDSQYKNAEVKDVYMFALTFSHLDSVVYVTKIQLMENETVYNGYFLENRDKYESILLDYMYGMGESNRLAVVYFNDKEKNIVKKKQKVLKRIKKRHSYSVGELLDFSF
jgi:hypothetical protein